MTGFLAAVRQPLLFQMSIQPVTPPRKYWESVCRTHVAWAVQGLKRLDRRGQLHAIVGGERLAAFQLLFASAVAQYGAPTAGAGIARTGAVGPDRDTWAHRMSP